MGAFDERPRFFEGQYLSADDLSAVVDYLRGAQARQALGASTWGIGLGLGLVEQPAPGAAGRQEVVLQPGWARDGFGRQIVVQQPTRLAETLFASLPYNASVDGGAAPVGRLVKVWLAYAETGGRPPAPGFETCSTADNSSRVEEGFNFMIGELSIADQRDPVVIGAETVDALEALSVFEATAPALYDTSVPHQSLPGGDGKPPRWLVPVGQVRWVAGNGVLGYFVDRGLVAAANIETSIRAFRRYGGCVVQNIEASDGAIVLRARGDDPAAPHRFEQQLLTGQTLDQLRQDLVWVEGGLRCEGDAKLAGSRLLLRNPDGQAEGNELYLARAGDGSGLPGQRELRAVIGSDAQADNRFVVGPEAAATPGQQLPQLVVLSSGRAGINQFNPACTLHARGDAIRLEDGAGVRRIEMRSDGNGVELRSDTNRLYLRSAGPAAQNNNRVIINPTPPTDGRVGIGVEDPQTGLDVHEDSAGFSLDRGNGGRLELRSAPDAASRDKVFLEASVPAGGAPSPELRASGPAGTRLPLFSAYADVTYLNGKLGVNEPAPAAETQVHVRGTRIRLQSVDGTRSVDLRTDGSAVDLQSTTNDLFLRSTNNTGGGTPRHIVMNPYLGDGNVGIGLDAPLQKLHVNGSFLRVDGSAQEQAYLGSDGSVSMDGLLPTREVQIGSFNAAVRLVHLKNQGNGNLMDLLCDEVLTPSDAALKKDVAPLTGSLDLLGRLHGVQYQLRDDATGRQRTGFIAQELAKTLPQAVTQTPRGLAVSYMQIVPVLVEAVKELQQQVQALQARIETAAPAPKPRAAPAKGRSSR